MKRLLVSLPVLATIFATGATVLAGCPVDDVPVVETEVVVAEGGRADLAVVCGSIDNASDVLVDDDCSIEVPIGASGGTITVDGTSVISVVTVTVLPLSFSRTVFTDGPAAREHGAMMASSNGDTLFVIGGGGYPNFPDQEMLDDAWQFDVATSVWSPWTLSGDVIPPGASRRVAQDGDVAFLSGGYGDAFASLGEMFRIDLDSGEVTLLDQGDVQPPLRSLHAFAFDAASQRFVVFGGFFDDGVAQDILGDTWVGTLTGTTVSWQEVTSPLSPSPRYGMFFGSDPTEGLVVFSGAGFPAAGNPINAADDAWVFRFDDLSWFDLLPKGEAPVGRRNGCGVVDPANHRLTVFGGTADGATTEPGVFLLDVRGDGRWDTLDRDGEPPRRSSSFGTARPGGGITCGFGNDQDLFQDLFTLGLDVSASQAP